MRGIRVKLDENLGLTHVKLLREFGYAADRVHEEGLSGAADDTVWRRVCEEDRLFITLDVGFADVRRFPPGSHPGILVLRPRTKGRDAILQILARLIHKYDLANLRGCLVIADEKHIRIRRPSSSTQVSKPSGGEL